MKVKIFQLTFDDKCNPNGQRWLRKTFESQLSDSKSPELNEVLDATTFIREQALSSNLFSDVEGSLKWWISPPTKEPLPMRAKSYLMDACSRFRSKVLPAVARDQSQEDTNANSPLAKLQPISLDLLRVHLIPKLKKNSCSVQTNVDSSGNVFLDLKGSKVFPWTLPLTMEGGVKACGLKYVLPNFYASISHPIIRTGRADRSLDMLEIKADSSSNDKLPENILAEKIKRIMMTYTLGKRYSITLGLENICSQKRITAYMKALEALKLKADPSTYVTTKIEHTHDCLKMGKLQFSHDVALRVNKPLEETIIRNSILYNLSHKWKALQFNLRTDLSMACMPLKDLDVDSLPLSKRLFLGGTASPSSPIPLRGFKNSQHGGLEVPSGLFLMPTLFNTGRKLHLGGVLRGAMSLEFGPTSFRTLLMKECPRLATRPLISEMLEKSAPFGFVDAGFLTPSFSGKIQPEAAAGFGIGYSLQPGVRISGTIGAPISGDSARRQCAFQVSDATVFGQYGYV